MEPVYISSWRCKVRGARLRNGRVREIVRWDAEMVGGEPGNISLSQEVFRGTPGGDY